MRNFVKYLSVVICICILQFLLQGCSQPMKHEKVQHAGFFDSNAIWKKQNYNLDDTSVFYKQLNQSYQAIRLKKITDLWYLYYYQMSFWHSYLKINERAIVYTDSMLWVFQKHMTDPEYADLYLRTLLSRGDVLVKLGKYDDAFSSYYMAREMIEQQKDTCTFVEVTNRLAGVGFSLKKYREAAELYKQAYKDLQHCTKDLFSQLGGQQASLDNVGVSYFRAGQLDSAFVYFNKALLCFNDLEKIHRPDRESYVRMSKAVIYGNLGELFILKGQTEKGEDLLKQSIATNNHPEMAPEDAAISMVKLLKYYLDKNRISEAGVLLGNLELLESRYDNPELHTRYLSLKARYLSSLGKTKDAYFLLEKASAIRDSLRKVTEITNSSDIQKTFNNIRNQYQLQLLETKNRRKTEYLFIAIIFSAMILLIVLLLLKNYRHIESNMTLLKAKNSEIIYKNEELLNMLESLEQSHRDKQKLLHVVAHDLRSPVGSITMLCGLLKDKQVEAEKVTDAIELIAKSANNALELINELLQDPAAARTLKNEYLNLTDKIRYCVEVLKHKAAEKNQRIIFDEIPINMYGDREKLVRVFHNLISNAIKFSMPNTTIHITMQTDKGQVLIKITDQGIGFPPGLDENIFLQPGSLNRTGTAGEPSYGLGLSIVYQIVKAHKGLIWFNSEEGKGTSFYIEFPTAGGEAISN